MTMQSFVEVFKDWASINFDPNEIESDVAAMRADVSVQDDSLKDFFVSHTNEKIVTAIEESL